MNTRAYTSSTTIAAALSIVLLMLVCCCLLSVAFFGFQMDRQQEDVSSGTIVLVVLFSCCGLSLPTIPLTVWGLTYLFESRAERDVDKNLASIHLPDAGE